MLYIHNQCNVDSGKVARETKDFWAWQKKEDILEAVKTVIKINEEEEKRERKPEN